MLSGVFLSDLHMLRSSECWPLKNSKPLEHPPDLNSVSSWGRDGESIPFIKAAVFHGEAWTLWFLTAPGTPRLHQVYFLKDGSPLGLFEVPCWSNLASFRHIFLNYFFNLNWFIWLHGVLVATCRIFTLHCGVWDLDWTWVPCIRSAEPPGKSPSDFMVGPHSKNSNGNQLSKSWEIQNSVTLYSRHAWKPCGPEFDAFVVKLWASKYSAS